MKKFDPHSDHSSRREKILENLFIGEVLKELWQRGIYEAELLHGDIDAAGYDLVLETQFGVRHIQLKAVTVCGKTKSWPVNGKIVDKPSGCVIVIRVNRDTLDIDSFYWFGESIGSPCRDLRKGKVAKRSTSNSLGVKPERADSFVLTKSKLESVDSFSNIVNLLIGTTL